MKHLKDLIENCDLEIRTGMADRAAKRLATVNTAEVPRDLRLPLAHICRRAGLWNLGISLLAKIVYPSAKAPGKPPTPAEMAEYGILLCRIGATAEAEKVLMRIDMSGTPEALHYLAIVKMTKWEFPEAVAALNRYLQSSPSDYLSLIAKVNLASAHVESRNHEVALNLLEEISQQASTDGHRRLLTTCLAFRSQVFTQKNEFKTARRAIREGELSLESGNSRDRQQFVKWSLILQALEKTSLEPLNELAQLASKSNNWEDVRLSDLYSCRIKFNTERFLHLVFGTPHAGFREQICREIGRIPDRSLYYYGSKRATRMDIRTGELSDHSTLSPGKKCHQLIEILLRDFYHPLRIAGIFSELFPGDHFDLASSPDRTHQVINRTRRWLLENQVPVEIHEAGGFYSLIITGNFSFLVPLKRDRVDGMNPNFFKLIGMFSEEASFTALQVRTKLKLSRQMVQRLLNWGIENHRLERSGTGKRTKYQLIAQASDTEGHSDFRRVG